MFGHEHYAEHLEDLACAAVPIRHPVSGRAVGAVNLTSWRRDACPLLIALAQSTARQVTQGLLDDSSAAEFQAAAGVPAGLPVRRRIRLCADPRHGADERPGAGHARPR